MLNSPPPHALSLPPREAHRFRWLTFAAVLAVLAVLVAVMFAPLWGGFFQYDDFILLEQAQRHWSLAHPFLFLTVSQNGLFTPLNNLIFYAEFRAFGLHPLGYECVSVALHWLNCLLVSWIAWRLTRSAAAAWTAGIVFAVGFGKVEAVTWVAAFVHLVTTLCYLASVACFLGWLDSAKSGAYAAALAFFVLGMFSKEPIVSLPLAITAAAWLFGDGNTKQRLRAALPFWAWGALYVAGMVAWQKLGPAAALVQHGVYKPGLAGLLSFGALGGMLVPAPYDGMLRFLGRVPHLSMAYLDLSRGAALLVVPLLAWAWVRGTQATRFGVLWVALSFLPFLFVSAGIASRYLYLPSVGLSLAVAGAVPSWLAYKARARTRLLSVVVALVVLANVALFAVWQRQQNQNGAMRKLLIAQVAALPARAPQIGTVCAANVSTKYHDIDLALPLWINHAPHFKMGNACRAALPPVAHYILQDRRLVP